MIAIALSLGTSEDVLLTDKVGLNEALINAIDSGDEPEAREEGEAPEPDAMPVENYSGEVETFEIRDPELSCAYDAHMADNIVALSINSFDQSEWQC